MRVLIQLLVQCFVAALLLLLPAAKAAELSDDDRIIRDENLAKLDKPLEEMRPKELQELLRVRGAPLPFAATWR